MKWWHLFWHATRETKWFIFAVVVSAIVIVALCFWPYARLPFVRSGPSEEVGEANT